MEVLIIISPQARMIEIKKAYRILRDLIRYEFKIGYLQLNGINKKIPEFLKKYNYGNYRLYNNNKYVETIFLQLRKKEINKIIIVGLIKNDNLTKYLDCFIGTNTELYITASEYGIMSDGDNLINQGAHLLSTIYDLMIF